MLFQQQGLRPGLCVALRIQLSDAADVGCVPEGASADLAQRLEAAATQVRDQDARLGVLIERDPDPGRVRMYILSSRTDQAVIAIEAIEDRPEPDVDRSLALKVRNAFELVVFVKTHAPTTTSPLSAVLAPPPPPAASAARPLWVLLLDAGAGLALGNGLRAVSSVALGLGRQRDSSVPGADGRSGSRWELALGARLYSERTETEGPLRLSMVERGPTLVGRRLWHKDIFEWGASLEAMLSVVKADGTARDGNQDTARLLTPVLSPGLELRVRLFSAAYLRFAPTLEIPTIQRTLRVDGEPLMEDAPVRASLPLSLLVLLPIRGESGGVQP
ncbi:MAG TPA: hypothetical protein VFZ61_16460 [Polyangiales bacterium]